jgi:hypothetical protein
MLIVTMPDWVPAVAAGRFVPLACLFLLPEPGEEGQLVM